jgi:DNA-binding MarR family transcriptional regulator
MQQREEWIGRIMSAQARLRRLFAEDRTHPLLDLHLTMSQLKILVLLSHHGEAPAHVLAGRMGVSLATLTGIVDRLIAQGLVGRREDPADRRVRRIALTADGAALVDRLVSADELHLQRILARLDQAALCVVAQAYDLILDAAASPDCGDGGDGRG